MFLRHRSRLIAAVIMVIHGIDFMSRSMQVSPALRVPLKYLFLAVPVGGVLNLVFMPAPAARTGLVVGLACRWRQARPVTI